MNHFALKALAAYSGGVVVGVGLALGTAKTFQSVQNARFRKVLAKAPIGGTTEYAHLSAELRDRLALSYIEGKSLSDAIAENLEFIRFCEIVSNQD